MAYSTPEQAVANAANPKASANDATVKCIYTDTAFYALIVQPRQRKAIAGRLHDRVHVVKPEQPDVLFVDLELLDEGGVFFQRPVTNSRWDLTSLLALWRSRRCKGRVAWRQLALHQTFRTGDVLMGGTTK